MIRLIETDCKSSDIKIDYSSGKHKFSAPLKIGIVAEPPAP
jgi:hypothetical protein